MTTEELDEATEQNWNSALHLCPDYILEAEVERRKKQKFEDEIPKPRSEINAQTLQPVADLCQSYIDQLAQVEPYADDKLRQFVFEAAMEVFFGKEVWVWVKKRQSM
jgi:hypothetical protein